MSRSRVYPDTWVLAGLVLGGRRDRGYFKRMLRKLDAGTIDVVVPQAVLGEAVAVVMRKSSGDSVALVGAMLDEIRDLVDPRDRMPSTTAKIAGLATNLSNDMGVEFTDALILSHALCDPHSTHLITNDQKLLSNKVKDIELEMRNNSERSRRLSVSDNFSHR